MQTRGPVDFAFKVWLLQLLLQDIIREELDCWLLLKQIDEFFVYFDIVWSQTQECRDAIWYRILVASPDMLQIGQENKKKVVDFSNVNLSQLKHLTT